MLLAAACGDDSFPDGSSEVDEDGYSVTMQLVEGELHPGEQVTIEFEVMHDGQPVAGASCDASYQHAGGGDAHGDGEAEEAVDLNVSAGTADGSYQVMPTFDESGMHHMTLTCEADGETITREFEMMVGDGEEGHDDGDMH